MKRRIHAVSNTRTVDCLRFSVSNLPPRTDYAIQHFSHPGASLEENEESMDFAIHFRPPLSRTAARNVHVGVVYCGQKIQRARTPYLCHIQVLTGSGGCKYSLRKDFLDYELFETHQLRTYNNDKTIGSLYLTFENNMTRPDHAVGVYIELKVDMTLKMLPRLLPGEFLMWFPPDVDPAAYGINIDPRLIPQRTRLWFKLRGISGTKAYILVGFMVPKKGSKDAETYNFYKSSSFGSFQRSIMRLGSLMEDYALLSYFSEYKWKRFQEMGWCPAPKGYPCGWGASPDGLIIDDRITWSDVPHKTSTAYKNYYNISRGVCEIKTSERRTDVSAYYIPQMYMEMISLECVWADLLRFHHCREYENGKWIFKDKLYVYRIYRDPDLETEMVKLWKYALEHLDTLVDVVATLPYVNFREKLETKAKSMKPSIIIEAPLDIYERYTQHRDNLVYAAATKTPEEMEASESQQLWCDLNERHKKLLCLNEKSERKEMLQLMNEQIQDYSFMMKQLF